MSDPQDLLYTNKFVSETILTDQQLYNETQFYDRFKTYVDDNKESEIEKYINNDTLESSPINLTKTLNRKWPITNSRNHYPLFDTYINDISSNRYKKEIVTKVNIDSANRDISQYLYPNTFSIPFPKVFNNIKSIVVNDICIKNPCQSISPYNNTFAWQFASGDYLVGTNIDLQIIPVPDSTRKISYVLLPYSVLIYETTSANYQLDGGIEYECNLSNGNYTIVTLVDEIRRRTSDIYHSGTGAPGIIEQPYLQFPLKQRNSNLFSIDINPISSIVKFVNRIEELKIISIQTFSPYENNFQNTDIFYPYTSLVNEQLDTSFIYITLGAYYDSTYEYFPNDGNILSPSAFPLVITNLLSNIGNINYNLINYTEFYDINIYTNNDLYTESEIINISYYKFSDYITLSPNKKYLRFAFKLSDGNINGQNYRNSPYANVVQPSITETVVFSNVLNQFLSNNDNVVEYRYIDSNVFLGRALLFRFVFDFINLEYVSYEVDTLNVKQKSMLHLLGWPITNQTNQVFAIGINNGYRFVHTNLQYFLVSEGNTKSEGINYSFILKYNPQISLNLLAYGGDYYFVSENYIYIKIIFNTNDTITSQEPIVNAISTLRSQYNQVYNKNSLFQVPLGSDYTYLCNLENLEVVQIEQSSIFAKILVSNIPGNIDTITSNIINNNSFSINYDHVLDNISEVSVSLYDSNLQLLDIRNDYSFTLSITEVQTTLKETLVNSKTNEVSTTGHFI